MWVRPPAGARLVAVVRHQSALLYADPGPLIAFMVIPLVLVSVIRPMMTLISQLDPSRLINGTAQATAGMAVMFSLFVLKLVGASLLEERVSWHTWGRLRSSPAGLGEILIGKALPMLGFLLVQQAVLFGFSVLVFGLRPALPVWALASAATAWSLCILSLGTAASTLARTPAQLSAVGDILAVTTTILGGALVPPSMLPAWVRDIGPFTPGYWAMEAYRAALDGGSTDELVLPLLMLGGFTIAGLLAGIWFGRRTS
jgi:ABC-2 type transport system permease protein